MTQGHAASGGQGITQGTDGRTGGGGGGNVRHGAAEQEPHRAAQIEETKKIGRAQQRTGIGEGAESHTGASITKQGAVMGQHRSEEHTSELQSRFDLVCRLLLEKKK